VPGATVVAIGEQGGAMIEHEFCLLEQLIDERVRIAGDVLEVSLGVWAIHGSIPVDGEVILAEFSLLDEAKSVLDQLRPNRQ
jgi:hypothetical protein